MPKSAPASSAWHGISPAPRLASRNEQYERFYLGSASRNLMHAQQRAERSRADRLVDRFLHETF